MLVLKSILLCLQIVYPKSDEQRKRLNDAVRNILLFKNVAPVSFWWSEYGLFEINLSVCFLLMFLLYCLILKEIFASIGKKKGGGGRGGLVAERTSTNLTKKEIVINFQTRKILKNSQSSKSSQVSTKLWECRTCTTLSRLGYLILSYSTHISFHYCFYGILWVELDRSCNKFNYSHLLVL